MQFRFVGEQMYIPLWEIKISSARKLLKFDYTRSIVIWSFWTVVILSFNSSIWSQFSFLLARKLENTTNKNPFLMTLRYLPIKIILHSWAQTNDGSRRPTMISG